jgi:hypothetical protein
MTMDNLLDRYLDGELSDAEAEVLLRRLASEPELAAELRAHEAALATLADVRETPADGFTDRVMNKVREAAAGATVGKAGEPDRQRRSGAFAVGQTRWRSWAIAATVALFFAAGFTTARLGIGSGIGTSVGPSVGPGALLTGGPIQPQATGPRLVNATSSVQLRTVRLVYVPQDTSVGSVAVAGDFNGWQPASTPLIRRDGVWSTVLALPPSTYEYMFVVDGERWETDPLASGTRDDGFGGTNAVLDLTL